MTDISNAHHPSLATPQPPWQQTSRLVCAWTNPVNLYPTNAPDPFKSESYERTKWVRCSHLNAPHSHVQA